MEVNQAKFNNMGAAAAAAVAVAASVALSAAHSLSLAALSGLFFVTSELIAARAVCLSP